MPINLNQSMEMISQDLTRALEEVQTLKLDLSEEDSIYDLSYISSKLARVTSYLEVISNRQLLLTQTMISVRQGHAKAKSKWKSRERELKSSEDYREQPRDQKSLWIEGRLAEDREEVESWSMLNTLATEVREAVLERAGTLKRLDSDLRLHMKVYEAKVGFGIVPKPQLLSGPGNEPESEEITLGD